jgi:hypothetical protein
MYMASRIFLPNWVVRKERPFRQTDMAFDLTREH